MQTRFVLINTSHAGNVGAAARAMKVMGFHDLVLVAPRWANVLRREETIQRASGALDVLEQARIVPTLNAALEGMTHVCATAMTPRDFGPPTMSPRDYFTTLAAAAGSIPVAADGTGVAPSAAATMAGVAPGAAATATGAAPCAAATMPGATPGAAVTMPGASPGAAPPEGVAFLFGSERFGMRNEDVYRCHVALCIPTNPAFGSLNLAAALQVIAYEWRLAQGGFPAPAAPPQDRAADAQQVAGLLAHWEQALAAIDYLDPASPKKLMPRLNQLFNRAGITQEEIHILRGVAKAMLQAAGRSKG